ncbi:ATG26 [Symbiodinium natans]|uniref:ATG26 protein n=1 Tax=Symbiodinium natans TaxID=878477 RepID=A0A812JP41_9DINO|nr:ATG26 [Symbiodinium natans]
MLRDAPRTLKTSSLAVTSKDAVSVFADCSAVIEQSGGMSGSFVSGVSRANSTAAQWLKSNPGACAPANGCLQDFQPQLVVCGTLAVGTCIRYEAAASVPVVYVFLCRELLDFFGDVLQVQPHRPCFLATSPLLDCEVLPAAGQLRQTGTWDLPDSAEVPLKLQDFLDAGEAPVAIGWGSMIAQGMPRPAMLGLAIRALRQLGARGVVLGGWARLEELAAELREGKLPSIGEDWNDLARYATENICCVSEAPHSWLFPRCSCIVHHGGVGTTQAAVRSGKPSVITPIFGDQFQNSLNIKRLGVGVGFTSALPEISVESLTDAIRSAWNMSEAAASVGTRASRERGLQDAAQALQEFLLLQLRSGLWDLRLRELEELKDVPAKL